MQNLGVDPIKILQEERFSLRQTTDGAGDENSAETIWGVYRHEVFNIVEMMLYG